MQNTPTFPIQLPEGAEPDRLRDALQHLLTRVIDARDGHDAMLKRAEPKIAPLIRKFREEHHQHAERITALLAAVGGKPDATGSLMGNVNKAVVSLRALFDDLDDDVLGQVADGEDNVLEAFDDAMSEASEGRHREDLARMRAELEALVGEARRMAD